MSNYDKVSNYNMALGRTIELAMLLSQDMDTTLAEDDLTRSRARLLWELHEHGPVSQRALAQALDVSARNITGLADGLAEAGFVIRRPHPGDRRATLVTLTEKGTRITRKMAQGQRQLAHGLFSGIPEEQLEGYVRTLDLVVERLQKMIQAAER